MAYIEISGLNKRFGDTAAVNELDIDIQRGEIFGLLGPNGAGKSTTISMITTLLKQDSGTISISGMDTRKESLKIKRIIGYVPQEIVLYPTLTARENLIFWGQMYDLRGERLKKRVDDVLEIVSLSEQQKQRIQSFSGGMKRRINIAAALLHEPEIIIMDEPTVGIDPQSRNYILETVLELNKSKGTTVLYTTHYMEEVELLCSRICIMDHGRSIALGRKEELRGIVGNEETIAVKVNKIPDNSVLAELAGIEGINKVMQDDSNTININTNQSGSVIENVIKMITMNDIGIFDLNIKKASLESVFLHLTGRNLRD